MFRLVLLFGLLTFATSLVVSCANEVPKTDIQSERFESIIQEVLDYGPPLREATANPRGDTLHLTITVEYGTGEKLTNGILDYAFGAMEVAEEADAYHLGINIQYPDGQIIASAHADRLGMFDKP